MARPGRAAGQPRTHAPRNRPSRRKTSQLAACPNGRHEAVRALIAVRQPLHRGTATVGHHSTGSPPRPPHELLALARNRRSRKHRAASAITHEQRPRSASAAPTSSREQTDQSVRRRRRCSAAKAGPPDEADSRAETTAIGCKQPRQPRHHEFPREHERRAGRPSDKRPEFRPDARP